MATPDQTPESPESQADYARALRGELERRIAEFGTYPDGAFGNMTALDAVTIVVLFVLVPALFIWIYR